MNELIKNMEDYAIKNDIPIMQKDGIDFLCDYIKQNNVKTILEIGTAIGYSSIRMALVNEDINVITIERDEKRYNEALKNIKKANLEDRIKVYLEDALYFETNDMFDLIFIDAAKAQYIKFFNKYSSNLNKKGTIISDNLLFHGFVEDIEKVKSKNLRQLVKKIIKYRKFLEENTEFKTIFYNIGDGVAVTRREE
ncbi:MAG: O-methyltransferase [Bacilli bacterium]|nr:O-methyltransferase [Bacilli bacterium]